MVLEVVKAQISVGSSMVFWGMYIFSAIIIALILTGSIFKD